MELGILILIILGSFIFKKGKSNEESPQKPVPTKDMTWEEMEEYYGITLSRDSKEPEPVPADLHARKNAESLEVTYDPVNVESYEVPTCTDTYEEPVTTAYRPTYEQAEASRLAPHREEVRKVVPSHHRSSRKESLRSAVRHGMVWSMILETPKGANMMRRHHR